MAVKSSSGFYQKGLALAESGQYEKAFGYLRKHLESCPGDGLAWNDAGTVLYCLGQVDEAIKYFEKARGLCPESELGGVYWNMFETYLDGGYPDLAVELFDEMERFEILNADCLNRTANAFLEEGAYGNAIEMLMRSLSMSGSQEILHPMIEVIRSKRVRVAFFAADFSESVEHIYDFVKQRFAAELHVGKSAEEIRRIMEWCDIAWFEGFDEAASQACSCRSRCKVIVRVHNDDVYEGRIKGIEKGNFDAVVLGSNSFVKRAFVDSLGEVVEQSRLVTMDYVIDVDAIAFRHRERGKNIACVCDLNPRSNPMFLLQCMQKLHYLDSGYRLYVAGQFADKATEQYVNYMVQTLGLSEVVMFEGAVEDLSEWFSDKHYVVWAGIGQEGFSGVFKGMASGLKPVVHNFPGSLGLLDSQFVFSLSEDFCSQVVSENYEPQRYRDFVVGRYGGNQQEQIVNDILVQLEKEITAERQGAGEEGPVNRFEGEVCEMPVNSVAAGYSEPARPVEIQTADSSGVRGSERKVIAIKPLGAEHVQATPVNPGEADYGGTAPSAIRPKESAPVEESGFSVSQSKRIDEAATEALKASRALSEMIDDYTCEKSSGVEGDSEVSDVNFANGGYAATSPETAAAEEKLNRMVSEFCDDK